MVAQVRPAGMGIQLPRGGLGAVPPGLIPDVFNLVAGGLPFYHSEFRPVVFHVESNDY